MMSVESDSGIFFCDDMSFVVGKHSSKVINHKIQPDYVFVLINCYFFAMVRPALTTLTFG